MKAASRLTFEFVIQADLESLVDVCLSLAKPADDDERLALVYGQMIVHFLRGETDRLSERLGRLADEMAGHPELYELDLACALRERIRLRTFDAALLEHGARFLERAMTDTPEPDSLLKWRGEIAMLLATAYTVFDDYKRGYELFGTAAHLLTESGFVRKSLRAQMNMLVCESHVYPGKNLFARYHDLYRQSIKRDRREMIVATTCLLNISREYQRAGAFLAALKYCNRALLLFERQMGDMNYYLTLVHRAQLHVALGRLGEARIDVDTAAIAPFKEVHAALEVLRPLIDGQAASSVHSADLLPTWRERLAEIESNETRPKLSTLEEKLVSILSRGPKERVDLVDEIYGDRLDAETKQNRFKSLIGTFRKKCPDLIVYDQGRYRLADEILVSTNPRVS